MRKKIDPGKIDVVILCGGEGRRLQSVVKDRPKPMADIGGQPFLDILIRYFQKQGFRRFILCAGYKGEIIKDHYDGKRGDDLKITTLIEGKPLGTGGAVKNAESAVRGGSFLVVNGDSFCPFSYTGFLKFHARKKALYSMAVIKRRGNYDGGLVSLDKECRITSFGEKTRSKKIVYINAGAYLLSKKIFTEIRRRKKISLEHDVFPGLTREKFYGYAVKGKLTDIGTPDRYVKARRLLNG